MEFFNWKKIIAIFVVIAFIGIGLAWATEQGSSQFQEKAGTPIIKKHKRFPILLAILGAAALGAGVYFLTKQKDENNGGNAT
jgi:drug/metabolite transporter (DMT)-like permease